MGCVGDLVIRPFGLGLWFCKCKRDSSLADFGCELMWTLLEQEGGALHSFRYWKSVVTSTDSVPHARITSMTISFLVPVSYSAPLYFSFIRSGVDGFQSVCLLRVN